MSELQTIIESINNQAAARLDGCLSMRAERILLAELEKAHEALRLIASLNGQPTAQDIARATLVAEKRTEAK